jgi:hypothetical protein
MKAVLYLLTYNEFLPYLAGLSAFIFIAGFISNFIFFSYKNKDRVDAVIVAFNISSLPAIAFFILVAVLMELFIKEPCNLLVARTYHTFHAHVANLCMEQADRSNCPKNEGDLKAFNPEAYESLQSCTEVQYSYNQTTGFYRWAARFNQDNVFVSSPDQFPSYQPYTLSEARELGLWN